MKHEPKNVQPMAGFISLRWVVKKSSIIEITDEAAKDIATLHVDAMGADTEDKTEARVDDEVIVIMNPQESVAYGHKDLKVTDNRLIVKPHNIAAVLTSKKNTNIN